MSHISEQPWKWAQIDASPVPVRVYLTDLIPEPADYLAIGRFVVTEGTRGRWVWDAAAYHLPYAPFENTIGIATGVEDWVNLR